MDSVQAQQRLQKDPNEAIGRLEVGLQMLGAQPGANGNLDSREMQALKSIAQMVKQTLSSGLIQDSTTQNVLRYIHDAANTIIGPSTYTVSGRTMGSGDKASLTLASPNRVDPYRMSHDTAFANTIDRNWNKVGPLGEPNPASGENQDVSWWATNALNMANDKRDIYGGSIWNKSHPDINTGSGIGEPHVIKQLTEYMRNYPGAQLDWEAMSAAYPQYNWDTIYRVVNPPQRTAMTPRETLLEKLMGSRPQINDGPWGTSYRYNSGLGEMLMRLAPKANGINPDTLRYEDLYDSTATDYILRAR